MYNQLYKKSLFDYGDMCGLKFQGPRFLCACQDAYWDPYRDEIDRNLERESLEPCNVSDMGEPDDQADDYHQRDYGDEYEDGVCCFGGNGQASSLRV